MIKVGGAGGESDWNMVVIEIRSSKRPARNAELFFLPYIFLLCFTTKIAIHRAVSSWNTCLIVR